MILGSNLGHGYNLTARVISRLHFSRKASGIGSLPNKVARPIEKKNKLTINSY